MQRAGEAAQPVVPGSAFAKQVARCSVSSARSFLKPALALADDAGVTNSSYRPYVWGYARALWGQLYANVNTLVQSLCRAAGDAHGAAPGDDPKPLAHVFVRMRKYDETSSVVQCRWDHGEHLLGPGEQLVDMETGPTKIFVPELKIGMLFEK